MTLRQLQAPHGHERAATLRARDGDATREHDLEDAGVVVTVLAALAAHGASVSDRASAERSFWGDSGRRLIVTAVPGPHGWWASGLPR